MNELEKIRMAQIALQDVLPLFKGRFNLGPRFEEPETRVHLSDVVSKIENALNLTEQKDALEKAIFVLLAIWPTNYTWLTGVHHMSNLRNALNAI